MTEFSVVLGLAVLPAAANFLGALLAEAKEVSEKTLSLALHAATGIVLAVVGLELMPAALRSSAPWLPIAAFVFGGAAFLTLERGIGYIRAFVGAGDAARRPLAIFLGVSLDLFSDGVMVGTASVVDPSLALILAVGQVPADLPEGFAAAATLRRSGVRRAQRLALAAGFAIPVIVGAAVGFLALRSAPELVTLSVLAMTGGALTTVVVEEMIPHAHEGETSTFGAIFLTAGFALFALVSVYLGA